MLAQCHIQLALVSLTSEISICVLNVLLVCELIIHFTVQNPREYLLNQEFYNYGLYVLYV
jgi:hypothetical protein